MNPNHVYAGHPGADTPEWHEQYDKPQYVGATCKRCGAAINDLTQHREFHNYYPQADPDGVPIIA